MSRPTRPPTLEERIEALTAKVETIHVDLKTLLFCLLIVSLFQISILTVLFMNLEPLMRGLTP